jgi:voltage-gated potassium channel
MAARENENERWASRQRRITNVVTSGRVVPYLITITVGTAALGGLVVWRTDPSAFPSFGAGVWFALQTVTTVGYGDQVPNSAWGKTTAAIVMVTGISFLTFTTAIVASAFVAYQQRRLEAQRVEDEADRHDDLLAALAHLEQRLDELETTLRR